MGSAIGDFYVHLHARNYNRAGIHRLREGRMEPYNYQRKISDINKKIPSPTGDNELIKENLERLMGRGNPEDSAATIEKVRHAIEHLLGEEFKDRLANIDWKNLNVSRSELIKQKGQIVSKIRESDRKEYVFLKTIMARVRAIEELQTQIVSAMKRKELQQHLNKIYREIAHILNAAGTSVTIKQLRNMKIAEDSFNPRIRWDKKGINLVQMINEILRLYAINPLIAAQKGGLLEYAISGAWILAQIEAGKTVEDIVEAIRTQVTGKTKSKIEIDFTKLGVSEEISFEDIKLDGYIIDEYKKVAWSVLPTQEKVDVQLEYGDSGKAISAKNINLTLGYDISLVSGSPLSGMIQDEDNKFKGHYLNLVASHPDAVTIKQNHQLAHRAMKYVLLFKALTGQVYGRQNNVDTFILNDNSTGQIYVYSVEELLRKAASNLDLYASVNINGKEGTPIERMVIDNTRQKTWQDRLLHYAVNVHKQKVYASLSHLLFEV